jgi:hypothetical protein
LKTRASLQRAAFAISFVVVPVKPRAANSAAAAEMMPACRSRPEAFRLPLFMCFAMPIGK